MRHRRAGALVIALVVLLTGCSYEGQDAQDDLREIHGALRDADLAFESQRCLEPGAEEFTTDWRLHVEVDADGSEVAASLDGLFDVEEHDDGWRVERPPFGGFEGTISPDGTVELVARGVAALSHTVGLAGEFPTPCDEAAFPSSQPAERPIDPYVDAGIRPFRLWAHAAAESASQDEALAGTVTGECLVLEVDGGQHPVIRPHGTGLAENRPADHPSA